MMGAVNIKLNFKYIIYFTLINLLSFDVHSDSLIGVINYGEVVPIAGYSVAGDKVIDLSLDTVYRCFFDLKEGTSHKIKKISKIMDEDLDISVLEVVLFNQDEGISCDDQKFKILTVSSYDRIENFLRWYVQKTNSKIFKLSNSFSHKIETNLEIVGITNLSGKESREIWIKRTADNGYSIFEMIQEDVSGYSLAIKFCHACD